MTASQCFEYGNSLYGQGRQAEAAESYRRAISLEPYHAEAHYNLGVIYRDMGDRAGAMRCFQNALGARPDFVDARLNLAAALAQAGRFDEAIVEFRAVVAVQPDHAEANYQLSHALQCAGRIEEAIASFERTTQLHSNWPEAHNDLGNALWHARRLEQAAAAYRRALEVKPDYADAHSNLGNTLREQGKAKEAAECCRRALAIDPALISARVNLANALQAMGQLDEALELYRGALAANPPRPDVLSNMGAVLEACGRYDEALACYQQALDIAPDFTDAHWNLGCLLLLRGEWERGWREYDWRWRWPRFGNPRPLPKQPMWDGGDLRGRTILLHAEQGFGDTIQFVRFLPLVAQRGGRIVLEVQRELGPLIRPLPGVDELVFQGEPLPRFDMHCPLMSLPMVLRTTLENLPSDVPYLRPDPSATTRWANRLDTQQPRLKVGLAWAGRPSHINDHNRSIPPADLLPLAAAEGAAFFNLQKGDARGRGSELLERLKAVDPTDDLHDFGDTAAQISALDLVITVDTAVAHLAGAMGKEVWTLLPFKPEWRWLVARTDSPWYPTMRLFRQPAIGDWASVVRQVVEQLRLRV